MINYTKLKEALGQVKQALDILEARGYEIKLDPRGIQGPKFKRPGTDVFLQGYDEVIEEAGLVPITAKECGLY